MELAECVLLAGLKIKRDVTSNDNRKHLEKGKYLGTRGKYNGRIEKVSYCDYNLIDFSI
jgi:hypothetical protein